MQGATFVFQLNQPQGCIPVVSLYTISEISVSSFKEELWGFETLLCDLNSQCRNDEQVWLWLKGKNPEFTNVSGISNKLEVTTKDVRIINLASKYILSLPSGKPPGIICLLFIILSALFNSSVLAQWASESF